MAEAVFRHKVARAGLDDEIAIDSAGTGFWHSGEPPHRGTRRVLEEKGVSHAGITARQITLDDLNRFDYLITMDEANYDDVLALGEARGKVRPLLSYAPELGIREVPDPYYTGNFNAVYAMVDSACEGLLAALRAENGL